MCNRFSDEELARILSDVMRVLIDAVDHDSGVTLLEDEVHVFVEAVTEYSSATRNMILLGLYQLPLNLPMDSVRIFGSVFERAKLAYFGNNTLELSMEETLSALESFTYFGEGAALYYQTIGIYPEDEK